MADRDLGPGPSTGEPPSNNGPLQQRLPKTKDRNSLEFDDRNVRSRTDNPNTTSPENQAVSAEPSPEQLIIPEITSPQMTSQKDSTMCKYRILIIQHLNY